MAKNAKAKAVSYMDAKALDKEIPLIAAASKKLDDRIQTAALSCIKHRQDHGDPVYINRLYLALGKGVRKSAMTAWLLAFGGVVANEDSKTMKDKPFLHARDKAVDLEGAAAMPWFECKPDPKPSAVFDAGKLFSALVKRLNTAIDNGKEVVGMSPSQIDRLKAVMAGDVAEDVRESGL